MNQLMLVGRLVRPVEVKLIGDHKLFENTIAVSRLRRNKNGEVLSDFIPIKAWDATAEIFQKHCAKGQQVALTGRLQTRTYTDNQQRSVFVAECIVSEITLLDGRAKKANPEDLAALVQEYETENTPLEL